VAISAKPSYQAFRDWRVESNRREALDALEQGQYSTARRLALSVLEFRKDDYEMLRTVHRSMREMGNPRAGVLALHLMDHPQADEADRLAGFRAACDELPLAQVARVWTSLEPSIARSPEYFVPFVRRVIDHQDLVLAGSLLADRDDQYLHPEIRLLQIRALIASRQPRLIDRAQFEVADMLFNDDPKALEAFRLLSEIPPSLFRPADYPNLREWLARQENTTVDDHLLARIPEICRRPEAREAMIDEAIKEYGTTDPKSVASWLLRMECPEKVLAQLPEEDTASDVDLFCLRAQALIDLERWEEARTWLEAAPEDVPELDLCCLKVEACGPLSEVARSSVEWRRALNTAERTTTLNGYLVLHEWMSEAGALDLANEAMVEAVRMGSGRLPGWPGLAPLVSWIRKEKDGPTLHAFCSAVAALEPQNPSVILEALDIAGILGKAPPTTVIRKLTGLSEVVPTMALDVRFCETLATAYLLNDEPKEALLVLEGLGEFESMRPRVRVVKEIAAIQMLEDPTLATLPEIEWDGLLPEARQLLRGKLERITSRSNLDEPASLPEPGPLPELPNLAQEISLPDLPPSPEPSPLQEVPDLKDFGGSGAVTE